MAQPGHGGTEQSRRQLVSGGLRATRQRTLVLDIIRQGASHLDADEIHRRARRWEPRISLSTVYRILQRFKESGLIREYHFDDSHHHYEVEAGRGHHHIVCVQCGRVVEFDSDIIRHLRRTVPEVRDFSISEAELRLAGTCPRCREAGP